LLLWQSIIYPAGMGKAKERYKAACKARTQFFTQYPWVFVPGRNDSQAPVVGGAKLVRCLDKQLADAIADLARVYDKPRLTDADVVGLREQLAAQKSKSSNLLDHSGAATAIGVRQRVRRSRGTNALVRKVSKTFQNNLAKARSAIREEAQRVAKRRNAVPSVLTALRKMSSIKKPVR